MADEAQPLNREQRRRQKFHRATPRRQDNLRTQRQNSSGFLTEPPPDLAGAAAAADAVPGVDEATTENDKLTTGPGAGGATESADRAPHHEGVHGGPSRKE